MRRLRRARPNVWLALLRHPLRTYRAMVRLWWWCRIWRRVHVGAPTARSTVKAELWLAINALHQEARR